MCSAALSPGPDVLMPLDGGRRLAAAIPGAALVVLPGAGHYYMADATAPANEALLSFLAAHPLS